MMIVVPVMIITACDKRTVWGLSLEFMKNWESDVFTLHQTTGIYLGTVILLWNSLFVTEISSSESLEFSGDSEVALNKSGPFAPFSPEAQRGPTIRDDLLTCTMENTHQSYQHLSRWSLSCTASRCSESLFLDKIPNYLKYNHLKEHLRVFKALIKTSWCIRTLNYADPVEPCYSSF